MENRPAGFPQRLGAFALDMILILAYIIIVLVVFAGIAIGILHLPLIQGMNPVFSDLVAFVTVVLPVILYHAIQESSSRQATWGKRRLGLRVISKDGDKLSFTRSFARSVVKFLPWQIAHTCLFHIPGWPYATQVFPTWTLVGFGIVYTLLIINLITLTFTPSHRTLHDWVAGSSVVRLKG